MTANVVHKLDAKPAPDGDGGWQAFCLDCPWTARWPMTLSKGYTLSYAAADHKFDTGTKAAPFHPPCPTMNCASCGRKMEYDPENTGRYGQVGCGSCGYWSIIPERKEAV